MDYFPKMEGIGMQEASYMRYINTNICSVDHKEPFPFPHNCIHYVVEGYGYLKIKDQLFSLSAGQTFFIPHGNSAAYWSGGGGWKYIWINFDEWEFFGEILQKTAFSLQSPVCDTTEEQRQLFEKIRSLKWKLRNGNRYQTIGLTVELLASFIETYPSTAQLQEDASFKSLISFIDNNFYRKDMDLELLTRATGYSRSTLYERFHKEMNCTPGEYIRRRRMMRARHMLYTTDLPIRLIAASVGYEDPLYFSRIFHGEMGYSPSRHRAACRANDPSSKK